MPETEQWRTILHDEFLAGFCRVNEQGMMHPDDAMDMGRHSLPEGCTCKVPDYLVVVFECPEIIDGDLIEGRIIISIGHEDNCPFYEEDDD
jgi:hypothetical protein